jgi:hypothetical protein
MVGWWADVTHRTHLGIMWVIFGHLRPSGHIVPDHGGDGGAALLVLAPHDHLYIKHVGSMPALRVV